MRAIVVLAALIAAAPAVATAQDATERRLQRAAENQREMVQNQRIGEVERQVSNMEMRRQSEEVLRALQPQSQTTPTVRPTGDIARNAELTAAEARLRELARTQRAQVRDPASQMEQTQRIDQIEHHWLRAIIPMRGKWKAKCEQRDDDCAVSPLTTGWKWRRGKKGKGLAVEGAKRDEKLPCSRNHATNPCVPAASLATVQRGRIPT